MKIRKRFLIDETQILRAEEYAIDTNRTFSELVQEALKQMMRRYPVKREKGHKTALKSLEGRICELEKKIDSGYTQVHPGTIDKRVRQ